MSGHFKEYNLSMKNPLSTGRVVGPRLEAYIPGGDAACVRGEDPLKSITFTCEAALQFAPEEIARQTLDLAKWLEFHDYTMQEHRSEEDVR